MQFKGRFWPNDLSSDFKFLRSTFQKVWKYCQSQTHQNYPEIQKELQQVYKSLHIFTLQFVAGDRSRENYSILLPNLQDDIMHLQ